MAAGLADECPMPMKRIGLLNRRDIFAKSPKMTYLMRVEQ